MTAIEFKAFQIEHYSQRLEDELTRGDNTAAIAFLRAELHRFKKTIYE